MVSLKNNKNISVTFEGLKIDPFGQISITEERWAELYKKREIRESVAIGYLTATKKIASEANNSGVENKNKKGK